VYRWVRTNRCFVSGMSIIATFQETCQIRSTEKILLFENSRYNICPLFTFCSCEWLQSL